MHVYVCVCVFGNIKAVLRHALHMSPTPMPPHVEGEKTEIMKGNSRKMVALGLHLPDVAVSKSQPPSLSSLQTQNPKPFYKGTSNSYLHKSGGGG